MANEERFRIGRCYFLLGYYDREFRFPYIQSFVYVGKNLESVGCNPKEDRWYFQDPQLFIERGATSLQDFSEDSGIMTATQDALDGFVDAHELARELTRD